MEDRLRKKLKKHDFRTWEVIGPDSYHGADPGYGITHISGDMILFSE
jgi:hypothetical protein